MEGVRKGKEDGRSETASASLLLLLWLCSLLPSSFFLSFCFFPQLVHLFQRAVVRGLAALRELGFDVVEPLRELVDRPAQRMLGIDLQEPRVVHEREQQIAEFLFLLRMLPAAERLAHLFEFLPDLLPDLVLVLPVEPDLRRTLLDPQCPEQSRHAAGGPLPAPMYGPPSS